MAEYQASLGRFEEEVKTRDGRIQVLEGLVKEAELREAKSKEELGNC